MEKFNFVDVGVHVSSVYTGLGEVGTVLAAATLLAVALVVLVRHFRSRTVLQ